jgi:hypothetical protein
MRRLLVTTAVLSALLAACAPAGARTLVTYTRTGGFAGFSDHLTVSSAGAVRVTRRTGDRHYKLSARRLRALRRAVEDARFATLEPRYGSPGTVADGFRMTVRHAGHTVVVYSGARLPGRLSRLLDRLATLVENRADR